MRYFSTTLATDLPPADWRAKLIYALLWFIPRSNPDLEVHFCRVRRWYVEVDESGLPVREVGIDERGTPITAGPWEHNFGFWTDSGEPLPEDRVEEIRKEEFDTMWQGFADSRSNRSKATNA